MRIYKYLNNVFRKHLDQGFQTSRFMKECINFPLKMYGSFFS